MHRQADRGVRPGRPAATTRGELERVALALFRRDGFDATTVDGIAEAAGIGRRTFFRYFASKNDVVWGDFDAGLAALRERLAAESGRPLLDALRVAVLAFNALDPAQAPWHRERMELILRVPALQAHSTLRYRAWRDVVAEYVAVRVGQLPGALLPQLVAHSCLAAALTAYEQWLQHPEADLAALLQEALDALDGRWAVVPSSRLSATAAGRARRGSLGPAGRADRGRSTTARPVGSRRCSPAAW